MKEYAQLPHRIVTFSSKVKKMKAASAADLAADPLK
jgi:hypothetical protein